MLIFYLLWWILSSTVPSWGGLSIQYFPVTFAHTHIAVRIQRILTMVALARERTHGTFFMFTVILTWFLCVRSIFASNVGSHSYVSLQFPLQIVELGCLEHTPLEASLTTTCHASGYVTCDCPSATHTCFYEPFSFFHTTPVMSTPGSDLNDPKLLVQQLKDDLSSMTASAMKVKEATKASNASGPPDSRSSSSASQSSDFVSNYVAQHAPEMKASRQASIVMVLSELMIENEDDLEDIEWLTLVTHCQH